MNEKMIYYRPVMIIIRANRLGKPVKPRLRQLSWFFFLLIISHYISSIISIFCVGQKSLNKQKNLSWLNNKFSESFSNSFQQILSANFFRFKILKKNLKNQPKNQQNQKSIDKINFLDFWNKKKFYFIFFCTWKKPNLFHWRNVVIILQIMASSSFVVLFSRSTFILKSQKSYLVNLTAKKNFRKSLFSSSSNRTFSEKDIEKDNQK